MLKKKKTTAIFCGVPLRTNSSFMRWLSLPYRRFLCNKCWYWPSLTFTLLKHWQKAFAEREKYVCWSFLSSFFTYFRVFLFSSLSCLMISEVYLFIFFFLRCKILKLRNVNVWLCKIILTLRSFHSERYNLYTLNKHHVNNYYHHTITVGQLN